LQQSLRLREWFFVWLKTLQAKGGYSDYWKFGTFESWSSENGEEVCSTTCSLRSTLR